MICATASHHHLFSKTIHQTDSSQIILPLMKVQGLPSWLSVVVLLVSLQTSISLDMDTLIFDYSSRNLSAVPPDLPPSTQSLDLSQNQIWTLKKYSFHGTPRLHFLNLSWNILKDIHPDTFISTPLLATLDLSHNSLKMLSHQQYLLQAQNLQYLDMSSNLFAVMALGVLDLTANRLLDLPDCLGYPKLQKLMLRGNFLHAPSTETLKTCSHLTVVDISMNPYICTCPLRAFTNLIDDKGTLAGSNSSNNQRITMAHWPDEYQCSYPEYWKKTILKKVRLLEITCNAGLLAAAILVPAIILAIAFGILCHQLDFPWYISMIWKWTRAKRRARSSQQRAEDLQGVCFHAFISYSQRNASWVIGQLLPKLEGEDSSSQNRLRVCHHERDFIPGRPILDNILRCIEQSRCCVFVLSSHFVQSEWCHYELYFASHQRITRGTDNIILILLEPLPTYLIPNKYYQLKAMLARRTYLEWPQDKAKQRMFWANLRAALEADLPESVEGQRE
ncbi:hypothetical protein KOW79_001847 [Hemibagrus wyckioides]|uniref:TIR domain-containing protein n=1 Tax=Hemibagrus wyckioides TaxID=337641 RepID=A0A9D3P735_9TELE|nr:hypothetical protein KOW79_001847 [Hemibagrus wyckioides]